MKLNKTSYPQIYSSNGSTITLTMVILGALSLIALSYFNVIKNSAFIAGRHKKKMIAEQLNFALYSLMYEKIKLEAASPNSDIYNFFLNSQAGSNLEIKIPEEINKSLGELAKKHECKFSCRLHMLDIIRKTPAGLNYDWAKEGHGIFSVTISISMKADTFFPADNEFVFEKHHEYLIAALNTKDNFLKNTVATRDNSLEKMLAEANEDAVSIHAIKPGSSSLLATAKPKHMPYDKVTLYRYKNLSANDLERLNIINTAEKTINLSGIIHSRANITFDGNWKINGRGVLMANSFVFKGCLEKTSTDDLAIFYARKGRIDIETDQRVCGVLIATNAAGNGTITAKRPSDIQGLIFADKIDMKHWVTGNHIIEWDETLNIIGNSYTISFSNWPLYCGQR